MDFRSSVRFDRDENRVLDDTARLVNVAFPLEGDSLTEPGFGFGHGHPYRSALVALGRWGEYLSRKQVELGLLALEQLVDRLEQKSERAYWEAIPTAQPKPLPTGAAPLLAPGFDLIGVLSETRADQYRVGLEALAIVRQALAHWPTVEQAKEYA